MVTFKQFLEHYKPVPRAQIYGDNSKLNTYAKYAGALSNEIWHLLRDQKVVQEDCTIKVINYMMGGKDYVFVRVLDAQSYGRRHVTSLRVMLKFLETVVRAKIEEFYDITYVDSKIDVGAATNFNGEPVDSAYYKVGITNPKKLDRFKYNGPRLP